MLHLCVSLTQSWGVAIHRRARPREQCKYQAATQVAGGCVALRLDAQPPRGCCWVDPGAAGLRPRCHGFKMYVACNFEHCQKSRAATPAVLRRADQRGSSHLIGRAANSMLPAASAMHKAYHAAMKSHACSKDLVGTCHCKANPCCAGWQGLAVPVPAVQDQPQPC